MESRELTHDQKCQIAALAASGKTAEECAKLAGSDLTKTILFLESIMESRKKGKKKDYVRLTPELREIIIKLHKRGYSLQGISNKTNVSASSCQRVVAEYRQKPKPATINEDFEKATDKLVEEMRANKPSEKENEPASAATEHKPTDINPTEIIPEKQGSCQDLIDEIIKDLVKISNWCCSEEDETVTDYIRSLGFIQGFTEALADKYRGYRNV